MSRLPIEIELALFAAVPNPVIPHVDGFGLPLFYGVVREALGTGIVCDEWSSWLWVAHFHEGCSNGGSILPIVEGTCYLDLCYTCYYGSQDCSYNVDWCIDWG